MNYYTLDDVDPNWPARWHLGAGPGEPGGMYLPVATIYVHHTVTRDSGDVFADVATVCDIDQGRFGKLSYSWNVHRSSLSWVEVEGDHRGAHTINNHNQSLNGVSFGVGVIGNYHPAAPNPPPMVPDDELIELIGRGIREFIIDKGLSVPNPSIEAHRDVYATACDGDSLYARMDDIRAAVNAPAPTPVPIPPPPLLGDDMPPSPAILTAHGHEWEFVRGTNAELFARIEGGTDDAWFSLGGILTSGPDAGLGPGGEIVVVARGNDGATWRIARTDQPKPEDGWSHWSTLGGQS